LFLIRNSFEEKILKGIINNDNSFDKAFIVDSLSIDQKKEISIIKYNNTKGIKLLSTLKFVLLKENKTLNKNKTKTKSFIKWLSGIVINTKIKNKSNLSFLKSFFKIWKKLKQ